LGLDNILLAGLAIYASDPKNSESNLLRELYALGRTNTPSGRSRGDIKKTNSRTPLSKDTNAQVTADA
jgi:hypothetical protein